MNCLFLELLIWLEKKKVGTEGGRSHKLAAKKKIMVWLHEFSGMLEMRYWCFVDGLVIFS